jgi:hypothetical protein
MEYLLLIFGPPLAVAATGVGLTVARNRPRLTRHLGLGLVLVGVGVIAVIIISFSACSPFDDWTCGSVWTDWLAAYAGWSVCVAILVGSFVAAAISRVRDRRGARL